MKTQEQIENRKAIKTAKRDLRETILANPEGFQRERVKFQGLLIDAKSKTQHNHSYEINNVVKKKDEKGTYEEGTYQGQVRLGYSCKVQISVN